MEKDKQVLITGAGGYLGLNLSASLVGQCRLRCLTRNSETLVSVLGETESVEIVQADLLNAGILEDALVGVDTVVHLAGMTSDSIPNQYMLLRVNVDASWQLAAAAQEAGVSQIIFPSTYHVYGRLRGREPRQVAETAGLSPASVYASSKAVAEMLFEHYSVPTAILRLSHIYGVGVGHRDWGGVLMALIRSALNEGVISLDEGAGDVRDYIHVNDVTVCLRRITLGSKSLKGVYNLGRGASVTLLEMAELIASGVQRVRGHKVEIQVPKFDSNGRASLDTSRIQAAIGFTSVHSPRDAIDEMILRLGAE